MIVVTTSTLSRKEKQSASKKQKLASDPGYREKQNKLCREWHNNNKAARKISRRNYRQNNKDKIEQAIAEWRKKNPLKIIVKTLTTAARVRATKRGLEYTIDKNDIERRISNGVCEATGLPLSIRSSGARSPTSPSLDRINPKFGYTPENTMVVCWQFNAAKAEFGLEDLLVLATALVSKYGLQKATA